MTDDTDDWMNPRKSAYTMDRERKHQPYVIERQKRTICFGSPGSITSWEVWERFDTEEERDKALKALCERHPRWLVRADYHHPSTYRVVL